MVHGRRLALELNVLCVLHTCNVLASFPGGLGMGLAMHVKGEEWTQQWLA